MTKATLVKPEEVKLVEVEQVVKTQVQKEPVEKSVTVNMTPVRPEVIFKGDNWCAMDVKHAYAAIVRSFKEMKRELYRKEYEKK